MAPKIERPAASSISMRTRSPNRRNGVLGLALEDGLDRAHLGEAGVAGAALARRGLPGPPSRLLETVPEPMMRAGAERPRLGGVRDQLRRNEKVMSMPALGRPKRLAVDGCQQRQVQLAVRARRRPARRA